jgi:glutamate formiminotransferase/formiminotetrahydrofolate cyclodeaminase
MGIPVKDIIECAVQSLGLNDVAPFHPNEKIIEYAVLNDKKKKQSIIDTDFLDELSINSPAPGGGSAAALSGSLGASLISMVAALTHEKKEMLERKSMMDEIGIEAQSLKDRLAVLIEEDANAFDGVMKANRLPKNTDDEKILRKKSIRSANKYAIEVPLETAEKSFRVLQLSEKVVSYGNPNSVSDTGVAAEVALAGVRGACLNVMINLSGLDNSPFIEEMKNTVNQLIEDSESLHKKIYKKTTSIIKS